MVKQIVPDAAHKRAARLRRFVGRLDLTRAYRQAGKVICFGVAPGDDLLCTAVLREHAKRGEKKTWMMSNHPELFAGNGDVDSVVPVLHRFQELEQALGKKWQLLNYTTAYDAVTDRNASPRRHIIAEICAASGIHGSIALRPYFHLTAAEREAKGWTNGMIAIQSSGLGSKLPMRNKQWFPERFQGVVAALRAKIKFVQIGSAGDPLLEGVLDLRGKTTIRETAAILANTRLLVGTVGFPMHLARAVECPAVIIFGGREAPWQSGYSCNRNLYSAVACAPCWQWNRCDHQHVCMENIAVADVVQACEEIIMRPRGPLAVDHFEISSPN